MVGKITLLLNLAFLMSLTIGALWGLTKGYKKGLYWFIVMSVYYLFFFLTINVATSFLWSLKMPLIGTIAGNFDSQLQDFNSMKELFTYFVQHVLEQEASESITLTNELTLFLEGIGMLAFKIIYTLMYFTVFLVLYKLFFGLVRLLFVRYKKDEPRIRTVGAMFGLGQTIIGIIVSLILFSGVVDLAEKSVMLVSSFDPKITETDEYKVISDSIKGYNNSYPVRLANLIKIKDSKSGEIKPATLSIFDSTYHFKYQGKKISLRKELSIYADTLNVYLNSKYKETNKLSDLKTDEVKKMFSYIKRSDLIPLIFPVAIEITFEQMKEELPIERDELYRMNWKNELNTLGEVAILSFELIELAGLNKQETKVEEVTIDGEQVQLIFHELANSQVITTGTALVMDPLLKKAGKQVQAIITIPEDLKMEDEIKAIGKIAKEVFDTKITLGDLQSNDPSRILKVLHNSETGDGFEFTVLLESRIITEALVNIFSNQADFEEFSVFVIPENIDWYDAYTTDGELAQSGELRRILIALQTMVPYVDSLDFSKLDLKFISQFNEEIIDKVFESRILTATVSTMLNEVSLGDVALVLADSIYDDDRYITKEELKSLSYAALRIYSEIACEDCPNGIDLNRIFQLDDESFDVILNSQIISNTIGKMVIDRKTDQIVVPTTVLETITIQEESAQVVAKEELKRILQAGQSFGFESVENFDVQVSLMKNLAQADDPKRLDDEKANRILSSQIIHATISKMLVDADEANENIIVPAVNPENESIILVENSMKFVAKEELKAMMQAIIQLDFEAFDQLTSINIKNTVALMDDLLNSAIIHASISHQLLNLSSAQIHIPVYRSNGERFTREFLEHNVRYVEKDEIIALADTFQIFGFETIDDINSTIDLTLLYDENHQETILGSSLIQYHLSKQINDDQMDYFVVPTHNYLEELILVTYDTDTYIHKSELKAMIGALEVLGITDVNSFDNSFDLSSLQEETAQLKLLQSAIIHATLSKKLIDLGSDVIVVPEYKEGTISEENRIKKVVSGTTYVAASEIQALIDSFLIMGYTNLENFEAQPVTSELFFNAREALLKSSTIQATISYRLLNSANIYIPDHVRVSMVDVTYVTKLELEALLDGLEELSLTNFDALNFNAGQILDLVRAVNFARVLNSQTIQATISHEILAYARDEDTTEVGYLIVPRVFRETIQVNGIDQKQIEKVELLNLLEGLRTIEIADFGASVNADKLNELTGETIDPLLLSGSIHLTISHMIQSNSFIFIPIQAKDTYYNVSDVITLDETKYFILSVKTIASGNNIMDIQFDYEAIAQINENDRDVILTSMIVRADISGPIISYLNTYLPWYLGDEDYEVKTPVEFLKKEALIRIFDEVINII